METIAYRFNGLFGVNNFQRVDENHILDLYIGFDSTRRLTLLLITDIEPRNINSSQFIGVEIGMRHDSKWALSLTLLQENYEEMFYSFCEDMIESSRKVLSNDEGVLFFCDRYRKWQKMLLKNNGDLLTIPEIKGLIGELIFLRNKLFVEIGYEKGLNSWIGPERADQDFVTEETWWEIKATSLGSEKVLISSIEQLDVDIDGNLVVVYLDKTSQEDKSGITLNSIISEIFLQIPTDNLKDRFKEILLLHKYYASREYDEKPFRYSCFVEYTVNRDFPCMRRTQVPIAVLSAKYELSINEIIRFKK